MKLQRCALILFALGSSAIAMATSLHPATQLKDATGLPVTSVEQRIDGTQTCGECHNTSHINDSLADVHKLTVEDAIQHSDLLHHVAISASDKNAASDCLGCHVPAVDKLTDSADADGWVDGTSLALTNSMSGACGDCHMNSQQNTEGPFLLSDALKPGTQRSGQIFSGQRISNSGLNVADKKNLNRSFDVHAERVVDCTDCHSASNNPTQLRSATEQRPDHLSFDPRRLSFSDYLAAPTHDFHATQNECSDCHQAQKNHRWLPYAEQHFDKLACESCHIPKLFAPALFTTDWSLPDANGQPQNLYRGIDGNLGDAAALVTGYQPLLLPDPQTQKLTPVNTITVIHWQNGDDILTTDDVFAVTQGKTTTREQTLTLLQQAGYLKLELKAQVVTTDIHHNVAEGRWLSQECRDCHQENSRLIQPFEVAADVPAGATLTLRDPQLQQFGSLTGTRYQLNAAAADVYIMGGQSVPWIDLIGLLMLAGVVAGTSVHGLARYLAYRKRGEARHPRRREYMYPLYDRIWHWTQAFIILMMIGTGAVIHRPDLFGVFSFPYMVQVHNVLAFILVVNAALALFYNLASGHIKQFIPMPSDLFVQSFVQAKFYIEGIFKGEAHPFEKSVHNKLNPMQKVAYFGLLNVLLPAQVLTGILMWGAQRWPDWADAVGGLLWLGPLHSLLGWAFVAFIIMHIYLTTTSGPKPLSGIKAMIEGWEDIEIHEEKSHD